MKTAGQKNFVEMIGPIARSVYKRTGYLASVLTAQAIQETGYGTTDLTSKFNIIGMKSSLLNSTWADHTVWNGINYRKKTIEFTSTGNKYEKYDDFRVYESFEQCLMDYCMFMTWAKYSINGDYKYRDLIGTKDPETLITQVAGRGYCTDPGYPKSIMAHIEKWDLTRYDRDVEDGEDTMATETIKIIDITSKNKPPRTGNTREALVFHFLGVAGADNPYLYGSGYGGQWYIARNGDIYHAVKPGGTVWAVGSGGWGLKGTRWNNGNTESVEMGCECDGDKSSIYDKKWWFHMATQESAVKLARYWLEMRGYGVSEKTVNERILVHNTITNKPCPAPWLHGAGYKSSREEGQVNWSFDEFKRKIWEGYDGKTTALDGKETSSKIESRNYLKKGDRGSQVQIMQEKLIACGFSCGSAGADGDFGNATLEAVKAFQESQNLTVDGFFGVKSKAALDELYESLKKKEDEFQPFEVRIKTKTLHIRKGPGKKYESLGFIPVGAYTIVEVVDGADSKAGWGRLKSGAGWISLDWAEKI